MKASSLIATMIMLAPLAILSARCGPTSGPAPIPVADIAVSGTSHTFAAGEDAWSFQVWNSGQVGSMLRFQVSSDAAWIMVDPAEGTSDGVDNKVTISVTIDRDEFTPETISGTVTVGAGAGSTNIRIEVGGDDGGDSNAPMPLADVKLWGYQIQDFYSQEEGINEDAINALVDSHYDMVVIEPGRTEFHYSYDENRNLEMTNGVPDTGFGSEFDTANFVRRIKGSKAGDGRHRKLVIAYIDIGQAENWRWYFHWYHVDEDDEGTEPVCGNFPPEWPDWILACDPDMWKNNYPVKYWDDRWKEIVITGYEGAPDHPDRDYNSILDEVLRDGFDGIYLDWVEAYEFGPVQEAAAAEGKDAAQEMIDFIWEMREYATERHEMANPNFIIIQQNAAGLIRAVPTPGEDDAVLEEVIDAIAQEGVWREGCADVDWGGCDGFDCEVAADTTAEYLDFLDEYKSRGMPVFVCEYAHNEADDAYADALAAGFIPYCTHRSLERLTDTPPPGYPPGLVDEESYSCPDCRVVEGATACVTDSD